MQQQTTSGGLAVGERQGLTGEELDRRFGGGQFAGGFDAETITGWFRGIAESLSEILPPGRETSLALTQLEQAEFWALAAHGR